MKVLTTAKFEKQYKKLTQKIQNKFKEQVRLFLSDYRDPSLCIHKLKGKYKSLVSMNVTGDYRALFSRKGDIIIFHSIGTHSQLY